MPYERLRAAGYEVDVIGARAGEELEGVKGKEKVTTHKAIDESEPSEYAALVIPGGFSPRKPEDVETFSAAVLQALKRN